MAIRVKKHTELGMRIAKAVALSGKNQAGFALVLEVHPSNLNRWISGEVAPSYDYLSRIGDISGVSLDWLLTGNGPIKRDAKEGSLMHEKFDYEKIEGDLELKEIVEILSRDVPELKKYVLKILKGRKELEEGMAGLQVLDKKLREGSK